MYKTVFLLIFLLKLYNVHVDRTAGLVGGPGDLAKAEVAMLEKAVVVNTYVVTTDSTD